MMLTQIVTYLAATLPNDTCVKSGGFFGFIPWYHYLPPADFGSGCDITNFTVLPPTGSQSVGDVPLILLAVVDDLLRIAGIVAIGFVLTGAVQYITSQGSPDQTNKARSTIINALIGLAITIVAVAFVSFLGSTLGGS